MDPCERAILVHGVRHPRQRRKIGIIPEPQLDERRDLGRVMELGLLGENDAPATFRFGAAHLCGGRWIAIAAAIAMRDLVEPVLGGDRPDANGLE